MWPKSRQELNNCSSLCSAKGLWVGHSQRREVPFCELGLLEAHGESSCQPLNWLQNARLRRKSPLWLACNTRGQRGSDNREKAKICPHRGHTERATKGAHTRQRTLRFMPKWQCYLLVLVIHPLAASEVVQLISERDGLGILYDGLSTLLVRQVLFGMMLLGRREFGPQAS